MPTPRPIIVASVGAIEGTSVTWPSRPITESPMSRPRTAGTIAIPIATSVPKVRVRITIAANRPIMSLLSVSGSDSSEPIWPPAATFIPAFRPGSAASRNLCANPSVTFSLPMSSSTVKKAVCLSSLICACPCWLNGLVALKTCGSCLAALNDSWIACLFSGSVTFPFPSGEKKTIGFLPFCWGGKRFASRSVAAWLSVPGSSRLLEVLAPTDLTRPTTTASSTTHAASTTHL